MGMVVIIFWKKFFKEFFSILLIFFNGLVNSKTKADIFSKSFWAISIYIHAEKILKKIL